MHGHGYVPPPPPVRADNGGRVALRVVFVALTLLSCGFLAWAAMLRLALLTTLRQHWWAFGGVAASTIGVFVFAGVAVPDDPDAPISDGAAVVIVLWLFLATVGVVSYYLVSEIRHFDRPALPPAAAASPGYLPPQTQTTGYGYPPAAAPPRAAQHPMGPTSQTMPGHQTQNPYAQPVRPAYTAPTTPTTPTPATAPTPPAQQPPPDAGPNNARIDQVRAELDELSDLLRRDKDQREGGR
ncbi:hypothetical protein [Streptomyces sp. NPDC127084]|uniref:hypothetical protein n=1 Tax=Streptomyces sp. NPDC127084 TaxID=3347133 RepID=UPI0036689FCF